MPMTKTYIAYGTFALLFLVGALPAQTIVGNLSSETSSMASPYNLNTGAAYAWYGTGDGSAVTDASNLASFSSLSIVGTTSANQASDSHIYTSYDNGSTSVVASPNFTFFINGTGGYSLTTTLLAPSETLSFYLTNYDTTSDLSASLDTASFSLTNAVLPTSSDGDGTGALHTYGVLNLSVTGTVGHTLTFTDVMNLTGVSQTTFSNVGINAVQCAVVPEPPIWLLIFSGALLFLIGPGRAHLKWSRPRFARGS